MDLNMQFTVLFLGLLPLFVDISAANSRPSTPRNMRLWLGEGSSPPVTVRWSPPLRPHGDITGYRLTYGDSDKYGEDAVDITLGADARQYVVNDLGSGIIYEFRVSAKNSQGYGPSMITLIRTPDSVPTGAPSDLRVRVIGPTAVRLYWQPPLSEQNGELYYNVRFRPYGDATQEYYHIAAIDTNAIIDGLAVGIQYKLQVQAYTSAGFGPWSEPIIVDMIY